MAEFIVVFREVLEAALIIGILYTFLNKTKTDSKEPESSGEIEDGSRDTSTT